MSIAAVKIAQKKAHLSDAAYRELLRRVTGKSSCRDLTDEQQRAVVAELLDLANARTKTPTEAKIWALWYSFRETLPERQRRTAYLIGIVRRAAGRDSIRSAEDFADLKPAEAYKAIEALKLKADELEPVPF